MTWTHSIKRSAQSILDYLRSFSPREDIYALGEQGAFSPSAGPGCQRDSTPGTVSSNPEAFKDLEIGLVMKKVYESVPRQNQTAQDKDLEYIEGIFHHPLTDRDAIVERQDVITELQSDEELWNQVLAVKWRLDTLLYDGSYRRSINGLKSLNDVRNVVDVIVAVRQMQMPESSTLRKIKDIGLNFDSDGKFREAEAFVKKLYVPYGLGDVIDYNSSFLRSISGVDSRREFYSGNRILLEVTERMLNETPFRDFINDEAKAVHLLETMKSKMGMWHRELFGFNLSGFNLQKWGKNERESYSDLIEYWLLLVNEALACRVPRLKIGDLSAELGFYLGAAALQRQWAAAGISVANPRFLGKGDLRAGMYGSINTTLIEKIGREAIVANDVISDRNHNLFIITGPNNGGKTTYIRQVGQMYWLAHLGMGVPAQSAEISLVDSIFTSFNTEDNSAEGTGLYLTELKRIAQFSRPVDGQPRMTPYSIVFFDEFANGTDHEESVNRTKIVLDYLSQKGVTAYFTTHKHEIADMVERGELAGAVNLAPEVRQKNGAIENTYRMLRNSRERSYGYIQAEAMGITPEALRSCLVEEVSQGLYPIEDTRLRGNNAHHCERSGK
ncbi:MAG: hypothetical protein JW950_00295 [Deltaproteobacteria bacterium]|nr:hypothetical protein [Deltaproteobacteria bacterium]